MNIFSKIGEWFMNLFKSDAEKEFGVDILSSSTMENAQQMWSDIIGNTPYWLDDEAGIRTINFAKFLCSYTSKKACMDLAVNLEGSERATWLKKCIDEMVDKSIRDKVEDACGVGGIMFKPNGSLNPKSAIDYIMPWNFAITEQDSNGNVLGAIFIERLTKGDDYFTRLEYHHFVDIIDEDKQPVKAYEIQNRAYKSRRSTALGDKIPLTSVHEWANLSESQFIKNIEKPLFAYFKMPFNNTLEYASPEGVSIFSNAIEELRDLDVAWSKKGNEVYDSEHITFVDENALFKVHGKSGIKERVSLPRFVKGLRRGVNSTSTIDEHVPTLLTEQRIADINSILSMISTKAGFSQGQFVLDRKTGRVTATEIESDDSETVETINDIRKALKTAINDLIYALNIQADLLGVPVGVVNALTEGATDEDIFYFKDLLASFEQDRTRVYQLMLQGVYSKRKYLKEYEGFSNEEIDEMFAEIKAEKQEQAQTESLFDE